MELSFLNGESMIFTWVVLPLLIFLSRIADQSIGTLRLIFVSKGYKLYAPLLGFFEVIIWLVAVSQILQHMNNGELSERKQLRANHGQCRRNTRSGKNAVPDHAT